MHFNIKDYEKDLLFIPIGGTSRVGTNLYVYHYKGKFLIVDFGCGFADDYLPGIDITVPDISFLIEHKKDVVGIVLTHAHEDHIGAIQHLWEDLECDIYASPFAATFLREKLIEFDRKFPAEIITMSLEEPNLELKPFKLEFVPLCHSIPEMRAILIRTEVGNVFHTGDWKFEDNPLLGKPADEKQLAKLGKEGILAVMGDSTNVFNSEPVGSERDLKKSMLELVKPCKNLVIITTFSSNLGRLEALIDIARVCGRKVALSGQNLRRIFNAGKKSGYLKEADKAEIIDEKDVARYNRSEVLVIATGCQGEPFASLTKMTNKDHRFIKVVPGDTVIFSSKIIPGNEGRIYHSFDKLVALGLDVMMEQTDFTHVSGHPSQAELKKLYELLKPKVLVPIHGEQIHLYYHKRLALSWGMKNVVSVTDGDVIQLTKSGAKKIGKVTSGELAVYGNYLHAIDSPVMKMRRKLRDNGICVVMLVFSEKYQLMGEPIVICPGYLDDNEDADFISYIKDEINLLVHDERPTHNKRMGEIVRDLEKKVKSKVKSIMKSEVQKIPLIQVVVRVI